MSGLAAGVGTWIKSHLMCVSLHPYSVDKYILTFDTTLLTFPTKIMCQLETLSFALVPLFKCQQIC